MSPRAKRWAPACCSDNAVLGFALAVETEQTAEGVVGKSFRVTIVDAVGVAHERATEICPLCERKLAGKPCAEVDSWCENSEIRRELEKTQRVIEGSSER